MSSKCPHCHTETSRDATFCSSCGASLTPEAEDKDSFTKTFDTSAQELQTGSAFAGRYQIIEELGRGGMGRVYRALDNELNEEVALKLIRPEIAADRNTIERFKSEIRLARKIAHPSVGRVHELMQHGGTRFITMEYVSGEDLKSFIRRAGQLSPEKAVHIARQIAEGLSAAHRIGVVHRDLKPQNIMIDRKGNAKILDFGIAKSLDVEGRTSLGAMVGTPGYMSPEQIHGGHVDERSDLYSLGAVLFEMLTGREPFAGETSLDILLKQKSEKSPDPAQFNPQTPPHLRDLVLRCLEKERENRCPSTEEFLKALNEGKGKDLDGHAPIDPTPGASPSIDREEREPGSSAGAPSSVVTGRREPAASIPPKKRFLIPFVAALFFALLAAAYFLFFHKGEVSEKAAVSGTKASGRWQNSIAVLPFRDFSPDKDQANLAFGMTDAINDRLTKLRGLKVIATTSVVRFRDTDKDIKEIGRELGVAHILEGTLQIERQEIRVRAQLINAETGFHLWSDTYERELDNIFDLQDEVSSAIAEALEIELTPEIQAAFKNLHPQNMEAYKQFLHGMNIFQSRYLAGGDDADFRDAEAYLLQAMEISPGESMPYLGLAWAYAWRAILSGGGPAMEKAMDYNRKALEISPESGDAIGLFAYQDYLDNDFESAFQKFAEAFRYSPNSPSLYWAAGVVCRVAGLYEQSQLLFDRGQEMNPMQPYFPIGQGQARFYQGDFQGALSYFNKNIALTQNISSTALNYIHCLIELGRITDAERTLEDWKTASGGMIWWSQAESLIHAARGEREEALAAAPFSRVYAMLGMKKEALEILDKDIGNIKSFPYLSLVNLPAYDSLRSDPQFNEILSVKKAQYEKLLKMVDWLED